MMKALAKLLNECVVQLTIEGQRRHGTGFFVAPGLILTCAHVVADLKSGLPYSDVVNVRYKDKHNFSRTEIKQLITDNDVALLSYPTEQSEDMPCVWLDAETEPGDTLYTFGYPDQDFPEGAPYTFEFEGMTGGWPPLMKFKQGQVVPGTSGAPLLNQRTGKVCGMLKFTLSRGSTIGGGGTPTGMILSQISELKALQDAFHAKDRRWIDLLKRTNDATEEADPNISEAKYEIHAENSKIGVIGDNATIRGGMKF